MSEKRSVASVLSGEYRKATKKRKKEILNEFVNLTGYNRSYASRKLRQPQKEPARKNSGNNMPDKRGRKKVYGLEVIEPLRKIWTGLDFACGKRVHAGMMDMLDAMARFGELTCDENAQNSLMKMSSATIDRLLRPSRKEFGVIQGRSTTKPGTLLKSQIPIRLGTEWDDKRPGFIEIDLVAHCGDSTRGQYINTLDAIDIATGWCETRAVINKAQKHVFAALKEIQELLPFPLLGIDSDNGSEFINDELLRWCEEEHLTFTRSRPYRKNDACHVEQKNWSVVRQNVGYNRLETDAELELLNKLYDVLRLHTNFFMPSVKLESKERDGSRIVKRYSDPITPYRRVLASECVSEDPKSRLTKIFATLNPIELRRRIAHFQESLRLMKS
jgi:hypothetical protein